MFSATPELDAFPHRGEARLGAGKRQLVDIGVPKMDRSRRFPGFFRARSAFIPARTEWRALPQLLCLVGRATPCAHLLGYRHLQAAQAETHTTDWSSVLRPQFSGVDTYPELGLEQIRGLFPIWHIPCCYKSYANIAKSEMYAGFVCPHRRVGLEGRRRKPPPDLNPDSGHPRFYSGRKAMMLSGGKVNLAE